MNGLIVTELPASSLGLYFIFKIAVVTKYATVDGPNSDPILLAGLPGTPLTSPTKGAATSDTQVQVTIAAVATTNGSPIVSYDVQIDDGLGGSFVEL